MPLFNPSSPSSTTLLQTLTFNGSVGTATSAALPSSGYRGIRIEAAVYKNSAASTDLRIEANGDTTVTKYYQQRALVANTATNTQVLGTVGYWGGFIVPSTTDYANANMQIVGEVFDYASTNVGKVINMAYASTFVATSGGVVVLNSTNTWNDAAAISTLRFYLLAGNFDAKSYIRIYGLL